MESIPPGTYEHLRQLGYSSIIDQVHITHNNQLVGINRFELLSSLDIKILPPPSLVGVLQTIEDLLTNVTTHRYPY